MMNLRQADIFEGDFSNEDSLVVVFGQMGYSEMAFSWQSFSCDYEELNEIHDPFMDMPNKPIQLEGGCWLWFVPQGRNHGMATDELEETLNNIFVWAQENRIHFVTTNGISNADHGGDTIANRKSDDERTIYLLEYMSRIEEQANCVVTLTSRNDVFIRNKN